MRRTRRRSSHIVHRVGASCADCSPSPLASSGFPPTFQGLSTWIERNGIRLEESVLERQGLETTTTTASTSSSFYDGVRKAGVTVAGGAMVGIGVVLIPLPVPFGLLVATSGLALLGTEYPEALELQDRVESSLRRNWEAVAETIRAHLPEPHVEIDVDVVVGTGG